MSMTERQFIRTANAIRDQLLSYERERWRMAQGRFGCVEEQVLRLQAIRRKLAKCELRGWYAAGKKLLGQIRSVVRDIPYYMQEAERAAQACDLKIPTTLEIYRDLQQVEEEFDELRYYPEGNLLAVSTDPIELRDVFLGDFEIQLRIDGLAEMRHGHVFRIVALDPHPAASNDHVTHPHVSDDQMCTGDAGAAINAALIGGRICDFFLLARSVLTTYNPDSPYVSLDNWDGTPCYECGYSISSGDLSWCRSCENDYCDECSLCCYGCDETVCISCSAVCSACEDHYCPSCMTECPECGRSICKSCLEEVLCPCEQERKEAEDEEAREEDDQEVRQPGAVGIEAA